jgi:hypothetical protein
MEPHTQSKKTIFAFLCALHRLGKEEKCYNIPSELKIRILSKEPSLLYNPTLIKECLTFVDKIELSSFIKRLPNDGIKAYVKMKDNNQEISNSMQQELDIRDKNKSTKPSSDLLLYLYRPTNLHTTYHTLYPEFRTYESRYHWKLFNK